MDFDIHGNRVVLELEGERGRIIKEIWVDEAESFATELLAEIRRRWPEERTR